MQKKIKEKKRAEGGAIAPVRYSELLTSKQIAFSSGPSATYCDFPQIPKAPNKKKLKIKTVSMFDAKERNIIAIYPTVMKRSYLQNQTN